MFQPRRQHNLGVYLLAAQLLSSDRIPPVTLGSILLQAAIFLGFIPGLGPKHTYEFCLLPSRVLQRGEWLRMLASTVMHGDDMHLYFNMISLLWKGRRLERLMGSVRFLVILLVFAVATSATIVGLSVLVDEVLNIEGFNLMGQCAVGFSGVLFALKVLHTTYFPHEDSYLLGWLPISSRFACWAELILIQLISPNASFVGHFAGILVGLAYTMGPLKWLVDAITAVLPIGSGFGTAPSHSHTQNSERTSTNWGSGTWGGGNQQRGYSEQDYGNRHDDYPPDADGSYGWRPESEPSAPPHNRGGGNWFSNFFSPAGMSEEEQIRRATEESLRHRNYQRPPYPEYDR